MKTFELKEILRRLTELEDNWYLAQRTKDKRKREKNLSAARSAIADYAHNLPDEVVVFLEKTIGTNALHYQHAGGDIAQSRRSIEGWIRQLSKDSSAQL